MRVRFSVWVGLGSSGLGHQQRDSAPGDTLRWTGCHRARAISQRRDCQPVLPVDAVWHGVWCLHTVRHHAVVGNVLCLLFPTRNDRHPH